MLGYIWFWPPPATILCFHCSLQLQVKNQKDETDRVCSFSVMLTQLPSLQSCPSKCSWCSSLSSSPSPLSRNFTGTGCQICVYHKTWTFELNGHLKAWLTKGLFHSPVSSQGSLLHPLESVYLLGLAPVALACEVIFPLSPWQQKLPFLPLLVTSVYSSLGICYSFVRLYCSLFKGPQKHKQMWSQRWVVLLHWSWDMRTYISGQCWLTARKMRFKGSLVLGWHRRLLGEKYIFVFL